MAKAENLAEELENKILGVVDVFNWCMIGRVPEADSDDNGKVEAQVKCLCALVFI